MLSTLLAGLLLVALLGLWLGWSLRDPQRLLQAGLGLLEARSGLRLQSQGDPSFALRPGITLTLPGLRVADPLDGRVIAELEGLSLALPWATVRGDERRLDRLVADRVFVDAVALLAWLDRQPPSDTLPTLPALPDGVRVGELHVRGDGWSMMARPASLARFHADALTPLRLSGELRIGGRQGAFNLSAQLGLLPAGTRYGLRLRDVVLDGNAWLPGFRGQAWLPADGEVMAGLEGVLPAWPSDWPALPPPMADRQQPIQLALALARRGHDSRLRVQREGGTADLQIDPDMFRDWWNDGQPLQWLPPSTRAYVAADALDLDGIEVEGIRLQIDDPKESGGDGR